MERKALYFFCCISIVLSLCTAKASWIQEDNSPEGGSVRRNIPSAIKLLPLAWTEGKLSSLLSLVFSDVDPRELPKKIRIVEVGPRDGLQSEAKRLSVEERVRFINLLSATGLKTIEVGSFVSEKHVPQLTQSDLVFHHIQKAPGVSYPVLVPNLKKFNRAIKAGVTDISVFTSPSDEFNRRNINCNVSKSLDNIRSVLDVARDHSVRVRGYVSCAWGCPYEGAVSRVRVTALCKKLFEMGCDEISLSDTIGAATPETVKSLLNYVIKDEIDPQKLAVHFHGLGIKALSNILAALKCGITLVDSSVGALGGCPYAEGAMGNVATEHVVTLCNLFGIETGVSLEKLKEARGYILEKLKGQTRPASWSSRL